MKTVSVKSSLGNIERYEEVSLKEWDNLSDSQREILIKPEGGIRFVKRVY